MQQLLDKLIVSIRYEGLLESDIDDIVRTTRDFYIDERFTIREGTHKNIGVKLHDPESIDGRILSETEVVKKYIYTLDNIEIIISKNSFDLVVLAAENYRGFKFYCKYIEYFMQEIENRYNNIVNITRVGVRKINNIYIRDIKKLGNYFKREIFNCCDINNIIGNEDDIFLLSGIKHSIVGKGYKTNIITESQLGDVTLEENGEKQIIDIYRNILDIDVYWDMQVDSYDRIESKLSQLNELVTTTYFTCLNDQFKDKLRNDSVEIDDNLVGGVSNGSSSI